MNASESITTLYKILEKMQGPANARMSVTAIVSNVIGDLQDEGKPITEKNITAGLAKYAADYVHASKSDVA